MAIHRFRPKGERPAGASHETAPKQRRLGRRRLLGGAGASGLMAAAGVFASASQASAANAGCCSLAHPPGTSGYVTMTYCRAHMEYLWGCDMTSNGSLHCSCCETTNYAKSAYSCQYN